MGASGTLFGHSNQLSYLRVPTNHHLQTLQPYSTNFLQNFYLNFEVKVSCPNIAGNKVKCSWGQNLQNTILGAWLIWRQVKIPELCKTSPYRQAKTRSCRGQTRFLLGQAKKYHIQLLPEPNWQNITTIQYRPQDICSFDLILYVPSTIFQLNRDGSSWVEPVLS